MKAAPLRLIPITPATYCDTDTGKCFTTLGTCELKWVEIHEERRYGCIYDNDIMTLAAKTANLIYDIRLLHHPILLKELFGSDVAQVVWLAFRSTTAVYLQGKYIDQPKCCERLLRIPQFHVELSEVVTLIETKIQRRVAASGYSITGIKEDKIIGFENVIIGGESIDLTPAVYVKKRIYCDTCRSVGYYHHANFTYAGMRYALTPLDIIKGWVIHELLGRGIK